MTVDADGNVLSVSVVEPRFRPDDVAVLLASRRVEAEPVGDHGLPLSVATDPANQYAFSVGLPTKDFAAAKLHEAREAYRKQYPNADMGSLLWRVEIE